MSESEPGDEELIDFDVSAPDSEPDGEEDSNPEISPLESLRQERDDYYDRWLRKEAEFQNYRRRVTRENETLRENAHIAVLRELLTVIDSSEQGLEALSAEDATDSLDRYKEGFELLLKELKAVLSRFDVVEIPALGEDFDPQVHEAVLREVSAGHRDGEVLELFRKGYTLKGRLVRPAQVKVSAAEE